MYILCVYMYLCMYVCVCVCVCVCVHENTVIYVNLYRVSQKSLSILKSN